MHTTSARQLIIQKYQEEREALCREQALSPDYWLAKAESYYNKRSDGRTRDRQRNQEEIRGGNNPKRRETKTVLFGT